MAKLSQRLVDYRQLDSKIRTIAEYLAEREGYAADEMFDGAPIWTMYRPEAHDLFERMEAA